MDWVHTRSGCDPPWTMASEPRRANLRPTGTPPPLPLHQAPSSVIGRVCGAAPAARSLRASARIETDAASSERGGDSVFVESSTTLLRGAHPLSSMMGGRFTFGYGAGNQRQPAEPSLGAGPWSPGLAYYRGRHLSIR